LILFFLASIEAQIADVEPPGGLSQSEFSEHLKDFALAMKQDHSQLDTSAYSQEELDEFETIIGHSVLYGMKGAIIAIIIVLAVTLLFSLLIPKQKPKSKESSSVPMP